MANKVNGKTIEAKVADAVLSRPVSSITIGGKRYDIAPPTLATLIMVSELIAEMPTLSDGSMTAEGITKAVLGNAKDYRVIGDIAAVLILGAKGATGEVEVETEEKRFFGLWRTARKETVKVDRVKALSREILENLSPQEVKTAIFDRVSTIGIGDFFAITTSLKGENILRATKGEVESQGTTAFGQQSQA